MELEEFVDYLNEKLLKRFDMHFNFRFEINNKWKVAKIVRLIYCRHIGNEILETFLYSWSMFYFFKDSKLPFFDWCDEYVRWYTPSGDKYIANRFSQSDIILTIKCIDFLKTMANFKGCMSFEELEIKLNLLGY